MVSSLKRHEERYTQKYIKCIAYGKTALAKGAGDPHFFQPFLQGDFEILLVAAFEMFWDEWA